MPNSNPVSAVQKTTLSEIGKDLADKFEVIAWGAPGTEANNKIVVALQLKNLLGDDLPVKDRIRLTSSDGATMTLAAAGNGTVLAGDQSDDIIIETDDGVFDLEVTYTQAGTVSVAGGATQGSGYIACQEPVDLTFA